MKGRFSISRQICNNTNTGKVLLAVLCLLVLLIGNAWAKPLAKPTQQQAAWQALEIGMFIHFGIETWQDVETDEEPKMEYTQLFDPPNVDTEQWVDAAEAMGAKYIIIVAKHHGGFCLWQTDTTPYSIKNSPYKDGQGDIVAELAESCRKRGMKMGMYLSPADFRFGAVMGGGGKTAKPEEQPIYDKIYRQQLIEVLSRYGEMMEVWFDGSLVIEVGDILQEYAPNVMIFQGEYATIRWVGNEDGYAPYPAWNAVNSENPIVQSGNATGRHGDPDGDRWLPNEADCRIRSTWFWNTWGADTLKSVDKLMDMYYNSVGHSSVLLLNMTPDRSGRMPEADMKRAAEFGAEIKRRFGKSLAETTGRGTITEFSLHKPTVIDHVITMEDIRMGERVREYVIEGHVQGSWKKIAEGSAVGYKKIDRFDPIEVNAVRLRVTQYAAEPIIKKLAVYDTTKDVGAKAIVAPGKKAADKSSEEQVVFEWSPEDISAGSSSLEFDLSEFIDEPTQYELTFERTSGKNDIEIRSVVLILDGVVAEGFTEKLDMPNTYNINITATPSRKKDSIRLRVVLRGKGGSDSYGNVKMVKAKFH